LAKAGEEMRQPAPLAALAPPQVGVAGQVGRWSGIVETRHHQERALGGPPPKRTERLVQRCIDQARAQNDQHRLVPLEDIQRTAQIHGVGDRHLSVGQLANAPPGRWLAARDQDEYLRQGSRWPPSSAATSAPPVEKFPPARGVQPARHAYPSATYKQRCSSKLASSRTDLFLGDGGDRSQDRSRDGRTSRGEACAFFLTARRRRELGSRAASTLPANW
jgi:type II secretory pathway pseudopilin PulG